MLGPAVGTSKLLFVPEEQREGDGSERPFKAVLRVSPTIIG
jgi:hypothetical protein